MKTVTLPVEWRKDDLFVGPTPIGWIISAPPNRYRVAIEFDTSMQRFYPTREAAMAALEAEVMALGVKDA